MVSHEEMVRELNEDFECTLGDMKPYVLQLQLKTERQRCALWIKKLCEPHTHSGLDGRKLRNAYSKALLNMLKRGIMEGPLLHRPPEGKLDPFPGYLAEYLREPEPEIQDAIPDWLADLDEPSDTGVGGDCHGQLRKSSSPGRHSGESYSESGRPSSRNTARERLEEILATHQFDEQLDSDLNRVSPNRKKSSRTVSFPASNYKRSPLDEVTNRRVSGADAFRMSSDDDDLISGDRKQHRGKSPERSDTKMERRRSTRSNYSNNNNLSHHLQQAVNKLKQYTAARSPPRSSSRSPQRSRRSLSPTYLVEQQRQLERNFDREVEMKVKIIENRLYEERLSLQQKNDEEIQKILDRKNAEIDEVKSQYKKKCDTAEEEVGRLEKKIQTVLRDAQIVRDNKDSQIAELKKLAEESSTAKMNSLEKKFHDLQAEHEQEKIELQKAQTASIQQLMDDTNERLQKMEDDYRKQSKAMADTIRELEKRIQVLTLDAEKITSAKQSLEQHKIELETQLERQTSDSNEYRIKLEHLEREHLKVLEDHKHAVDLLKEKHESQLNFARKEHQLTVTKNSDTISSLEEQLVQHKQALQDSESHRQRQLRELEQSYKQDKQHSDNLHDKKVRSLQKEMDQMESGHKKQVKSLEKHISELERELVNLQDKLATQSTQAEAALQDIRQQVERQQDEVYNSMKQQMRQVEEELESSKKARRSQTDEFEQKIKEIAEAHDKELKTLRESFEKEKQQLVVSGQQQREHLVANHEQEMHLLKKNNKSEKEQMEKTMKQRKSDSESKINDLSEQVHELKEELAQLENLRKQQLMELGLVKEEETQRMKHEHERAIERQRSELEREKLSLQKQHSADLESNIDKTNSKLKGIEKDYSERLTRQAEQVADLQLQLDQLQAEKHRLTDQLESRIVDNSNRYEEEKRSLRKQNAATVMTLKQEVELLKSKVRQMDRLSQDQVADHEEDLLQVRLEYEEKMRGLIPSEAREQLEATVNSLKNQVNTLKQRIAILQDS